MKSHTKNVVGINTNLTPGDGVAGTAVALNASDNRLHANTDYALLGFTSNLAFASLTVSGVDTGNLKVGGPILGDAERDSQMFIRYAQSYNAPLIPIINSQQRRQHHARRLRNRCRGECGGHDARRARLALHRVTA